MQDTIIISRAVHFSQDKYYANPDKYLWIQPEAKYQKNLYHGPYHVLKDRICGEMQYVPQFAFYSHKTDAVNGRAINLFEVIKIMQGKDLKDKAEAIQHAQHIGDKALKDKIKSSLPYITHTGVFIPRRNDALIHPSFTFQLDIDKLENADKVLAKVLKDRQVNILIASKSVSGKGVKALLFLQELAFLRETWSHEQYRLAYHQVVDILEKYFRSTHGVQIDTQMKAISQPFYLFYSPDLFINKNLKSWI